MGQIIIVGIKKETPFLAEELADKGFEVTIIEKDRQKCRASLESHAFSVINGDATHPDTLEEAGIRHCKALLCLTGSDATNFVICKLVRTKFHIARILTWLHNPHNEDVFAALGIQCCFNVVNKIAVEMETSLPGHDTESFIRTTKLIEMIKRIYRKANILKGLGDHQNKLDHELRGKVEGYEETAKMMEGLLNLKVFIKKE